MTYAMKPIGCDPARIKGMSERLIVSHYENNYGGAVKRLNLIEEKLAAMIACNSDTGAQSTEFRPAPDHMARCLRFADPAPAVSGA